jgi:hypothetical protein
MCPAEGGMQMIIFTLVKEYQTAMYELHLGKDDAPHLHFCIFAHLHILINKLKGSGMN